MNIEIIARAAIVRNRKILLCKAKEKNYYFLPGGHIEFGENLKAGLKREIQEELGLNSTTIEFFDIVENFFVQNKKNNHEINFIFSTMLENKEIKSKEKYIEFEWFELDQLKKVNLLPETLKNILFNKIPNAYGNRN